MTGIGPWHIRRLSDAGLKLGGGIDTPSLCGRIRPLGDTTGGRRGGGGWDLEARITRPQLEHCCSGCRTEYEREVPQ